MKEFSLFDKDTRTFKESFYILMDILISNQASSRAECVIFMGIYYLQILTGFFSEQVGIFDIDKNDTDKVLNYFEKILRLKDLFKDNYSGYKICIIFVFLIILAFTSLFFYTLYKTDKNSTYTIKEILINFYFKFMIYIVFNIVLDLGLSNFCFGSDDFNPYFKNISCKVSDNILMVILSILTTIMSVFFVVFIQFFYIDSFYSSNSFYARMACNYEIYTSLNCIVYSVLLTQIKYISKEVFLIYNIIVSSSFFYFYLNRYLFYDTITNNIAGLFHMLYLWTSIFFTIFAYIDFYEKGLVYLISSGISLYFYFNLKYKIEEKIFLDTPYYKIVNPNYRLFYIKNLIDKMNHLDENPEDKALLAGIIQMHAFECPNPDCQTKSNEYLYLPITGEMSDRSKLQVEDKIFLMHFILIVLNYYISANDFTPDIIINVSLYYLTVIGNFCQSMFYYKKVKDMKLTLQEQFSFERLKLKLSKSLVEKLKPPNEKCDNLEDLNVSLYFKYENLTQLFIEKISTDISLSLQFWKIFRNNQLDYNKTIDFNQIFNLTDKIRLTKLQIQKIWERLIKIYTGVNELFDIYSEYIEEVNDDDLKKRDLDNLKRKSENFSEHIGQNYYSILFNKETGIIIVNGDKGKEGVIEKCNSEIEKIFKFKFEELKGQNISMLMPKLFSKIHKNFMERYFKTGHKKLIDQRDFNTFAKDKDNSIILIKIIVKLFPILNDSVYFIGLIYKESIDDLIFIDNKFYIQGMSLKLMKILNIGNKMLFQENKIPFYAVCKKFVNFYKIFLQGQKQNLKGKDKKGSIFVNIDESLTESKIEDENEDDNTSIITKRKKILKKNKNEEDIHENVEINENMELEYEIQLPEFIIEFSDSTNKGKKTAQEEHDDNKYGVEHKNEYSEDENVDDVDEFKGESDFLLGDDTKNKDISNVSQSKIGTSNINPTNTNETSNLTSNINLISNTPTPGNTPTPDGNNINNNNNDSKHENNNNSNDNTKENSRKNIYSKNDTNSKTKIDFNKQTEQAKEFSLRIKQYEDLFKHKKFDELEQLIDNCTSMNSIQYKFNFTFKRYKYDESGSAYIIRCIDTKFENNHSESESIEEADPRAIKYKTEKYNNIKPLYKILLPEKADILNQIHEYNRFLNYKEFKDLLKECKEDISKMSMIHGTKKYKLADDENASQSSEKGYANDLVKKNRILEIKASLLNNIQNFFTLKYIKAIMICIFILTLTFVILYLVLFKNSYDHFKVVSNLNIQLYENTIWTTNLLGTLISLYSLYLNKKNNLNYNFNSFISDNNEYFETMKNYSYNWYNQIADDFGDLENVINDYIDKNKQTVLFWDEEKITYTIDTITDTDSFPLAVSQVLSDINSLLKDEKFILTVPKMTRHQQNYFEYISFLSIENAYDNLLPKMYDKLRILPHIFQDYNKDSRLILLYCLFIYGAFMVLFNFIYLILLYITNRNMAEGLEKVGKIKLELLEDIIKKIEGFNLVLKKFREKESKNQGNQNIPLNKTGAQGDKTNAGTNIVNGTRIHPTSSVNANGFNTDIKKFIPLNILSLDYLQSVLVFVILFSFLIPTYIMTQLMVNNTNKLIEVQKFIFGKILTASASIVEIKCNITECLTKNKLNFDDLININDMQQIVLGIDNFDELNNFYNKKYLVNACQVLYNEETQAELYQICMENKLVKSANNSDSLIKLIDETVDILYEDIEVYSTKTVTLNNGSNVPFFKSFLYSTNSFFDLETVFYNFVAPISNNFSDICKRSLNKYLNEKKDIVFSLIIVYGILITFICLYIEIFYIKKLIHFLSVSRLILKIIPTMVINNTPELETWIESKY